MLSATHLHKSRLLDLSFQAATLIMLCPHTHLHYHQLNRDLKDSIKVCALILDSGGQKLDKALDNSSNRWRH